MSLSEQSKIDYDKSAAGYSDYSSLPSGQLESQLIKIALGDCTGLKVLDLGGGTGAHAREAIELGAATVDIVDISPEMLKVAQDIEKSFGRENAMRFFEADVSKPISHLSLYEGGYDVVMGKWIFGFTDTVDVLKGMFRNIVAYLKPGGRFIGVRDADVRSPVISGGGIYGGTCKWMVDIPGGVKYRYVLHCSPPVEFEAASLEIIYSGSPQMYNNFGLNNVEIVPYESTEVVQKDPKFWKPFLERPFLAVVSAVKSPEAVSAVRY